MTEKSRKRNKQRVITIHDEKDQIVDFPLSNLPVPATNILDSPTRCYEANIEWSQIIEGHLLWLAQSGAWKDAQEDDYPAIEAILTFIRGREDGCGDTGSKLADCYRMDTTTEVFSYYPNDPFSPDPDDLTLLSGLRFARFSEPSVQDTDAVKLIADTFNEIIGYRDTDVFVTPRLLPDDIPPIRSLDDWLSILKGVAMPFPYVRVDFEGAGQLEIELLNIPFGGGAVLIPDTEFTLLDIGNAIQTFITGGGLPAGWLSVDLDRDIISFPPSLIVSKTIEFEFETDEPHFMHVVFHPKFDDEFPFFKFLGGIREMEFCGNIQAVGQQTGTLYDKIRSATDAQRIGALGMVVDQDMCDSIKCAILDLMEATLLGLHADNLRGGVNIRQADDGMFEVKISDSVRQAIDTAPKVIPEANLFGSAVAATDGISEAMTIIVDGHTNNVPQDDIVALLELAYDLKDGQAAIAVAAIHLRLDTPATVFDDWSGLAEKFYCNGLQPFSLATYIWDTVVNLSEIDSALEFAKMFTQGQFALWQERGLTQPREGYQSTNCYRIPSQTFVITPELTRSDAGTEIFDGNSGVYPVYNLFLDSPVRTETWSYLLYAEGTLNHTPSGDILQLYHKNIDDIWSGVDVRLSDGGVLSIAEEQPLISQSPYYAEFHLPAGTEARGIRWQVPAWDKADMTGSITLTLVDNGKVE